MAFCRQFWRTHLRIVLPLSIVALLGGPANGPPRPIPASSVSDRSTPLVLFSLLLVSSSTDSGSSTKMVVCFWVRSRRVLPLEAEAEVEVEAEAEAELERALARRGAKEERPAVPVEVSPAGGSPAGCEPLIPAVLPRPAVIGMDRSGMDGVVWDGPPRGGAEDDAEADGSDTDMAGDASWSLLASEQGRARMRDDSRMRTQAGGRWRATDP